MDSGIFVFFQMFFAMIHIVNFARIAFPVEKHELVNVVAVVYTANGCQFAFDMDSELSVLTLTGRRCSDVGKQVELCMSSLDRNIFDTDCSLAIRVNYIVSLLLVLLYIACSFMIAAGTTYTWYKFLFNRWKIERGCVHTFPTKPVFMRMSMSSNTTLAM